MWTDRSRAVASLAAAPAAPDSAATTSGTDDGFSLIELMVVVMIIAVLLAIAVPSYLGARTRAQDRSAQTTVRHGMVAEHVAYTDNAQFTASTATLAGIEPNIPFTIGTQGTSITDPTQVYAYIDSSGATTNNVLVLGIKSRSGTCFYMGEDLLGPQRFGSDTSCALPSLASLTASKW